MVPQALRLGTRGSPLALYQARTVARRIEETGGYAVDIVVIKTSGDRLQEAPLSAIGGKRLFVKEIEDALLAGSIDIAVHSSKDMSAVLPDGLTIAGVLPREDPRDAVVLPLQTSAPLSRTPSPGTVGQLAREIEHLDDLLAALGPQANIGTGSVRRIAQMRQLFPRATFSAVRGNLDTRLRKLDTGKHDALVLAAAGLRRLGLSRRIAFSLPVEVCVPAPGQGIVAIETCEGNKDVRAAVSGITDHGAEASLTAERALVEALGGGCQTPIGAIATPLDSHELALVASVVSVDGHSAVSASGRAPRADARGLGARVAAQLLAGGAAEILEHTRRSQTPYNLSSSPL